ncbi:hypothetical protein [Streptomyces sp. NPDC020681]|uniref:hypothetical protein n=1 Tax=Streptomyces sp. NPDC020681 TaxID=3365083 RepID=UPI00378A038C
MGVLRKKTGLVVAGVAVVVLAAIGGVLYAQHARGVAEDTRGYKLTPPTSVGEFKKLGRDKDYLGAFNCIGATSDSDCELAAREVNGNGMERSDARAIGITNVSGTGADYRVGTEDEPAQQKWVTFRGLSGQVADPGKAVERSFRSIKNGEQYPFSWGKQVGSPKTVELDGFKGARMKCQDREAPICVWADHSTVAATQSDDLSLSELASLTAELYKTSRTKR